MVAIKKASIFDILGKVAVILISSSILFRLTMENTVGWDDEMPTDLRSSCSGSRYEEYNSTVQSCLRML